MTTTTSRTADRLRGAALNLYGDRIDSLALDPDGRGDLLTANGERWSLVGRMPGGPWVAESGEREHDGPNLGAVLEQVLATVPRRPAAPVPVPPAPEPPKVRTVWSEVQVRAEDLAQGDIARLSMRYLTQDGDITLRWLYVADTYRDADELRAEYGPQWDDEDDRENTVNWPYNLQSVKHFLEGRSCGERPVLVRFLDDWRSDPGNVEDTWRLLVPYALVTIQGAAGTVPIP